MGKGRDVGLNQISLFEAKIACGNGEQTVSRDIYRLGHRFDFFRMMSCYFTTVGFYFSTLVLFFTPSTFFYQQYSLLCSVAPEPLFILAAYGADGIRVFIWSSLSRIKWA